MQYTHNVTMQPQLLGLMLRKDFWSKYKSIIVKEMFPSPMDKFYASVAVFHEKFNEDLDKNKLWEVLKMDNPTLTAAQKGDLYELVESIKEVEEWTPEFAETVLTQIWKQEVWRQVTEVGVKGLEGQMATLEPLSEIYRKHAERFIPQDSFVECAMGIDELLAADADTPKWNFALKPLQEKVGGMAEGQFMQLMARPDCYTGDVEVLTHRGWIKFSEYQGQKIAQVWQNTKTGAIGTEFVFPYRVIVKSYCGNLVKVSSVTKNFSVSVTPNHDMVILNGETLGKVRASELKGGEHTIPLVMAYGTYSPPVIREADIEVSEEPFTGLVYCVTVETGMLLVRSKGVVFICGNCGKTAFLTTLVCGPDGYANQGAVVDWYGNEEPIRRTRWRCMSAFTGKTKDELIANKPLARDLWNSIAGRVRTFDVPFGTPVEHIMARTKARRPNIVIVDQLDKLGVTSLTGGFAGETERIRLLYIKFREIAKQCNCLVIGVCQASADAEGQRIVTYDMAENSKTGKAAECDLFLGIGRSPLKEGMLEEDYTRWITVSKNKLDKSWKGVLTCRLEPTVSRYVE